MSLIVWGGNAGHSFPAERCIPTPVEHKLPDEGDEVFWLGWCSVIGRHSDGFPHGYQDAPTGGRVVGERLGADFIGTLFTISASNAGLHAERLVTTAQTGVPVLAILDLNTGPAERIVGFDNALAYLGTDGYIYTLPATSIAYDRIGTAAQAQNSQSSTPRQSKRRWHDVAATETSVFGITMLGKLYRFSSLADLIDCSLGDEQTNVTEEAEIGGYEVIQLPPSPLSFLRLYALETRAFVHISGQGMHQLLELVQGEDDLGEGLGVGSYKNTQASHAHEVEQRNESKTRLVSIEVDALTFQVIPGSKNRLGVLSETGEGWILDTRTRELELVKVEGSDPSEYVDRGILSPKPKPKRKRVRDEPSENGWSEMNDEAGEDPDEIEMMGVGAGFEVLVRQDGVWVKGDNHFGQLATGKTSDSPRDTFARLDIDPARVKGLICSRSAVWTPQLADLRNRQFL